MLQACVDGTATAACGKRMCGGANERATNRQGSWCQKSRSGWLQNVIPFKRSGKNVSPWACVYARPLADKGNTKRCATGKKDSFPGGKRSRGASSVRR